MIINWNNKQYNFHTLVSTLILRFANICSAIHYSLNKYKQMNAVILTQDQYNEIITRIDELKTEIKGTSKSSGNEFVDNVDFIKLMNISKRTAQAWRDEGKISFSQVGGKIYYKMSDVQEMLNSNYNPAFKTKK